MIEADRLSLPGSLQSPVDRRSLLLGLAGASLLASMSSQELDARMDFAGQVDLLTGTWKLHANNTIGSLAIQNIDRTGLVTGEALGRPIEGFWDNVARKLTFIRRHESDDWARSFTFTGHLMDFPSAGADGGYALAGTFQRLSSARQTAFGWYATVSFVG